MITTLSLRRTWLVVCLCGWGLSAPFVPAFPPAPPHVIFGMVRDELGNPLQSTTAELNFETAAGVVIKASIIPGLRPGVNYKMSIPMDSGITDDLYKPTALHPTVPFKIKVRIGPRNYLPIEMVANFALLGQPGGETRIDLTLGEDSDGDGLPDAWERALAARSGRPLGLADISPGEDFDHDGLSNLNEYLAGTYASDPKDGFALKITQTSGANSLLEFVTVKGRSYSILGSHDLHDWTLVSFHLPTDVADAVPRASFQATTITLTRARVAAPPGGEAFRFFKLLVQ